MARCAMLILCDRIIMMSFPLFHIHLFFNVFLVKYNNFIYKSVCIIIVIYDFLGDC